MEIPMGKVLLQVGFFKKYTLVLLQFILSSYIYISYDKP